MSYYKKRLLWRYFIKLKYAIKIRDMMIDDFEDRCFNEETWNYLI